MDPNPLKWHGGKSYLAERIIAEFPPHVHYVEPFFGGGAVLFAKPDELIANHSECVNDIDGDLTNFWRVLQDDKYFAAFVRRVQAMPLSELEWMDACDGADGLFERAVRFFVRYRQSRQGLGKCFATMSRTRTRRGMNEQVSSWLSALDGLPDAHERLKRVAILNKPAVDVIRSQDGSRTLYYCDPPYVHETRATTDDYRHEMTTQQHVELLDALRCIKGTFVLSGYRCKLYDDAADRYGWRRVDIEIDNKASGAKKKAKKVESLWMNY